MPVPSGKKQKRQTKPSSKPCPAASPPHNQRKRAACGNSLPAAGGAAAAGIAATAGAGPPKPKQHHNQQQQQWALLERIASLPGLLGGTRWQQISTLQPPEGKAHNPRKKWRKGTAKPRVLINGG